MKNLVCVIGGYAPYYSPSGKIADNVLQELKKDYDITVIAQKNYFGLPFEEEINGIRVIRINEWNRMFHHLFEGKARTAGNRLSKTFFKVLLNIKRIVNYIFRLLRRQSYSGGYVRKIIKQLEKYEKDKKIDILIPVSIPHEAVIASVKYKKSHPYIKLYPYKTDFFANSSSMYENAFIRKRRYPLHVRTERETLEVCDKFFALPPIADYYNKNKESFPEYTKIIKTEHPLLCRPAETDASAEKDGGKITLIYAGSLYSGLRNPDLVLNFLKSVPGFGTDYVLKLFSFGDCQAVIDKYKPSFGASLEDRGKVSFDEVSKEMSAADIIMTIGNNSVSDVPSKLFECLSYCKPIIHFYFKDEDPYLKYLEGYEYSLCIKIGENMADEYLRVFDDFCRQNANARLMFDEVKESFIECTPQFVAKQFADEFEK